MRGKRRKAESNKVRAHPCSPEVGDGDLRFPTFTTFSEKLLSDPSPTLINHWEAVPVAPTAENACRSATTGALFDKSKVGSDHPKSPEFLPYLTLMEKTE